MTIDTGLDAIQIAALRKCDDVVFTHRAGQSYIRAVKRAPMPTAADPFPQEHTIEIPCDTRWHDYSREFAQSYPMPEFTAFEMVGNYSESAWRTIASLLRKADRLMLHWSKDCLGPDSDLARAGFHLDRLELCIARGANDRLTFRIDDAIVRDGSSARMIRNVRALATEAV